MNIHTISRRRRLVLKYAAVVGGAAVATPMFAQSAYPSRLIRMVVPVAPGFGTDTLARILADELRKEFGLQIVVENKAGGAGGSVGAEHVFRADPDGYTLLFTSQGPLGINKLLYANLPYEPFKFAPIALVSESANVLLVRSDAKYKSLKELIAAAKAEPGKMTYGSGGIGTTTHLSAELLKARTGTNILHVPFKGSAAASTGLMSGQVDMFFGELGASLAHIKSGRLIALGVGSENRQPQLPDVPAIAEFIPGFKATVWFGLVAPPNTPPHIVGAASKLVVDVLSRKEVKSRLEGLGTRPIGTPSAEFRQFIGDDFAYWEKVIREAAIAAQ